MRLYQINTIFIKRKKKRKIYCLGWLKYLDPLYLYINEESQTKWNILQLYQIIIICFETNIGNIHIYVFYLKIWHSKLLNITLNIICIKKSTNKEKVKLYHTNKLCFTMSFEERKILYRPFKLLLFWIILQSLKHFINISYTINFRLIFFLSYIAS